MIRFLVWFVIMYCTVTRDRPELGVRNVRIEMYLEKVRPVCAPCATGCLEPMWLERDDHVIANGIEGVYGNGRTAATLTMAATACS
jgi:hypothetical protein